MKLTIIDSGSGKPTPARVELYDAKKAYVAEDALPFGPGDYNDRQDPWKGTPEQALARLTQKSNPRIDGVPQFYSNGASTVPLPPGNCTLKVTKGIEYRVGIERAQIQAGQTKELTVTLTRWINLPQQGWYGADGHIHVARPVKELNPHLAKWMQAEDIHVANLLQWGHYQHNHNTPQYAHGPRGVYREGDYLLASGQEDPRTYFLGHTVILGARSPIRFSENYLVYRRFWQETKKQGGLSGWAHGGRGSPEIDLPDGLLTFMEVLQRGAGTYDVWYDALNTGFRLTPVAGTDYPFVCPVPGRERFYTQVDGPLSYERWLDGIRRGRTFVTTGPVVEFTVDGRGMGADVVLPKPGSVAVRACVRFDPVQDDVQRLDIIENGNVLKSVPRDVKSSEIRCEFRYQVLEAGWLAVRASGQRKVIAPPPWHKPTEAGPSLVHSAPIYLAVDKEPGLAANRRAKVLAVKWIDKLDALEKRLAEDKLPELAKSRPSMDGIDLDGLRRGRAALLERIQAAKKYFRDLAH